MAHKADLHLEFSQSVVAASAIALVLNLCTSGLQLKASNNSLLAHLLCPMTYESMSWFKPATVKTLRLDLAQTKTCYQMVVASIAKSDFLSEWLDS